LVARALLNVALMMRASATIDPDLTPIPGEAESMVKLRRGGAPQYPATSDAQPYDLVVRDGSNPLLFAEHDPNLPTRSLRQRVIRVVAALAIIGTVLGLAYVLRTNATARRAVVDWITMGLGRRLHTARHWLTR